MTITWCTGWWWQMKGQAGQHLGHKQYYIATDLLREKHRSSHRSRIDRAWVIGSKMKEYSCLQAILLFSSGYSRSLKNFIAEAWTWTCKVLSTLQKILSKPCHQSSWGKTTLPTVSLINLFYRPFYNVYHVLHSPRSQYFSYPLWKQDSLLLERKTYSSSVLS